MDRHQEALTWQTWGKKQAILEGEYLPSTPADALWIRNNPKIQTILEFLIHKSGGGGDMVVLYH